MSSQIIKFGDKEVDKKEFCFYFVRLCRLERNSCFE